MYKRFMLLMLVFSLVLSNSLSTLQVIAESIVGETEIVEINTPELDLEESNSENNIPTDKSLTEKVEVPDEDIADTEVLVTSNKIYAPIGLTLNDDQVKKGLQITVDGLEITTDQYEIITDSKLNLPDIIGDQIELAVTIRLTEIEYSEIVNILIEMVPNESILFSVNEKLDLAIGLIEENDKFFLTGSRYNLDLNNKKDEHLEELTELYSIEIYNEGKLSYEFLRLNEDLKKFSWETFEKAEIKEDTIIRIILANGTESTYHHNNESVEIKGNAYFQVKEGKLDVIDTKLHYQIPIEIIKVQDDILIKDIEEHVSIVDGSGADISVSNVKEVDNKVSFDIKWKVNNSITLERNYHILRKDVTFTVQPQIISVGATTLGDLKDIVSVNIDGEILDKNKIEVSLTNPMEKFIHVGIQEITVRVTVPELGIEEDMDISVTVTEGESIAFQGYLGTIDMAISILKESGKTYLRATDFITAKQDKLHPGFEQQEYYKIEVYNGTDHYAFSRSGLDIINDTWTSFIDQEVNENSIIYIYHEEDGNRLKYYNNNSNEVSIDSGYYQIVNGKFKKMDANLPAFKVPSQIGYSKENMIDAEVKSLILNSITFEKGSLDDLEITFIKLPDTTKDADKGQIKITMKIDSSRTLEIDYEIFFHSYHVEAVKQEVSVGTQLITPDYQYVNVWTYGRKLESNEYTLSLKEPLMKNSFSLKDMINNVSVEVTILSSGFKEEVIVPIQAIAKETITLHGDNDYTDMAISLIQENDSFYLRASTFTFMGVNSLLHPITGNNPFYRVSVHQPGEYDPIYEFERKGSDIIGTGFSNFVDQKVEEGSLVTIWRKENQTIKYWENNNSHVNHTIASGNNPESYIVENGKLVRSNRAKVKFTVPEQVQYRYVNMSNNEIEQLVRESLILSYGRATTLSVKTLESPDNQAATSKGKYEISNVLDNGHAYTTQIEIDFYLYSFEVTATSTTPLEVSVGATSINKKLLNSVVTVKEGSVGRFLAETEYEINMENKTINEHGKFLYNDEINSFEISINILSKNEKKQLELYTKTVPGQTITFHGNYDHQQDIGLSIVEEDDGLWLRASDFMVVIKDNLHSLLYDDLYYTIEVIDENGVYMYKRFRNSIVGEAWKDFEDRKITKNTIVNIYHMEDQNKFEHLRYYNNTSSWMSIFPGHYRISNGKFELTQVIRPEFIVPEKIRFSKLNITEAEQLDLIKKNINMTKGDISDLEIKFIKQPNASLNESEGTIEISYEILKGVFVSYEFTILFSRTFVEANPINIPVGTVAIQNPKELVKVYSEDNDLLPESAYEAEVVTDFIKLNYVNEVEIAEVKVTYEEHEEVVSVPLTIVHGELFTLHGWSGILDMGLALIREEDGYWLRSADVLSTSRSELHDDFRGREYYRIDIYNNNQIYKFSRMGEERVGNTWELFEDQRINEDTIININHGHQVQTDPGRVKYYNSSNNRIEEEFLEGLFQMKNGHFVKINDAMTAYNVPKKLFYKSENMTEREIRDFITDSMEVTFGDISDLHIEVIEYPNQEKAFDNAKIKVTNYGNNQMEITTEYEIMFSAIQLTAKKTKVHPGTTKLYELNDFVEVKQFGMIYPKEKYRIEQVTETDIKSFSLENQSTEVTFKVIFEEGIIEEITIPLVAKIEFNRLLSYRPMDSRTDMGFSLIYEEDKLFLRGAELWDWRTGFELNTEARNDPQYKLEVYNEVDNKLENVYSFERKGSDKIGTGTEQFEPQELKEGSIISFWRDRDTGLRLYTSYDEVQEFLEGRNQKDYYIVENGIFKRITSPLPLYDMPDSVELKNDSLSTDEIENLVKQSIFMQEGQINNLSVNLIEAPVFAENAATAVGKVSVSYEIVKGVYIPEVHDVEFCLYSIKETPLAVVAGTLQVNNLAEFVEVTREGKELDYYIELKDAINIDTFGLVDTTVAIDAEVTLKESNQKRRITLQIPVVPDYSLSFHGYNQSNDLAIFVADEQDGMKVRASNFEESNETLKTVSDTFIEQTFYEIAFYNSDFNLENPRYTFTRLGSDVRAGGYKKFQPQNVSVGDIISIFRQQDSTIRYWNQGEGSDYETHEVIDNRKMEFYQITETGFDRLYQPNAPAVNNTTTTLNQEITGRSDPFNEISVYYENTLIASAKADDLGQFTIPLSNLTAGVRLEVTQKNIVEESAPTSIVVARDIPGVPSVDTITDRTVRVTGEGEPGATVTIQMGSRTIGTGTVNLNGIFTVDIVAQKAGIEISIYQTNSVGNSRARVIEVLLTSPDEANVNQITDRETQVNGTGKAGSAITISVDGQVLGSGLVDIFGTFMIPIEAQEAGTQVDVRLSNNIGISVPSRLNVILTAPDQPYLEQTPIDAEEVNGSGKAHSTVYVRLGEELLGTSIVLEDGSFSVDIPNQDYGNRLEVYLENKAGQSQSSYTTVGLVSPDIPKVNDITDNDTSITGTGTIGAEIVVKNGTQILGRSAVLNDGKFSIVINQQKVGTKLDIYAQNTVGMSGIIQKEVQLGSPLKPTVNEIQDIDTMISGVGKPDSEVFVEYKDKIIAKGKTNDDGSFALSIPKQLAETVLMVYQKNTVGISEKTEVIVQLTIPKRPNVNKTNELDEVVTGTGKEFSKVYVYTDDGQLIGISNVDDKGNFSVAISRQPAYTILHVMLSNRMGTSPSRVIMVSKRFSKNDIDLRSTNNGNSDEALGSLVQAVIGNSSLPKSLIPFDSFINGVGKDTTLAINLKKEESLSIDETLDPWDEGAIDIQSQAEKHDNRDHLDEGIEGLTELDEPKDFFVITTVSAGISSVFCILALINIFYVEKRYKNRKLNSFNFSLKR